MPRTANTKPVEDLLREMGMAHLPPERVRRSGGRAGKFLRVCSAKGEPHYLSFSTDLRNASGIGKGTVLDMYYGGGKLAIVVGQGALRLSKSGSGYRLACPLLLQMLAAKDGEMFPAEFSDGIIFVVLGEDRTKRAAEAGRLAQAAARPA